MLFDTNNKSLSLLTAMKPKTNKPPEAKMIYFRIENMRYL